MVINKISNSYNTEEKKEEQNYPLLETLSDNVVSEFIKKYQGLYFPIGFPEEINILNDKMKPLNKQIISLIISICSLSDFEAYLENKVDRNDTIEKLLLCLMYISKRSRLDVTFFNVDFNNEDFKSIWLKVINNYSIQELKDLFYFRNLTLDILNTLCGFDKNQQNELNDIIKLYKDEEFGLSNIFPVFLTNENLKNMKCNMLFLKKKCNDEFLKSSFDIFVDDVFNMICISNKKGSMYDLLLLPSEDFKIVFYSFCMKSMNDLNLLSLTFLGYKGYERIITALRKNGNDDFNIRFALCSAKHSISGSWFNFWIDNKLSLEYITDIRNICLEYEDCSFIYNNITKDPKILINLFKIYSIDVVKILYKIFGDAEKIVKLFDCCRNIKYSKKEDLEGIKNVIENTESIIKNDETLSDMFFITCKCITICQNQINYSTEMDNYWGKLGQTIAYLCKMFSGKNVLNFFEDEKNVEYIKKFYMNCSSYDIIKLLYEKGFCKNLDDLIYVAGLNVKEFIKFLYEKGFCRNRSKENFFEIFKDITIFNKATAIIVIDLLNKNHQWADLFLRVSCCSFFSNDFIYAIGSMDLSMAEKYVKICEEFDKFDSYDIQVIKNNLIVDILKVKNPELIVKKIDSIFLQSDIPLISKIFQVFKCVYPEDILNGHLNEYSSPYLKSCKNYGNKLSIIYQDLMRIMIESGESSLRQFIQNIIASKNVLYDFEQGKQLDSEGYKQIYLLIKRILSLNSVSNNKFLIDIKTFEDQDINVENLKIQYKRLKQSLLIKEKDSLYSFFLYLCKKIGYSSLEDIILKMDESQINAHNKGLDFVDSLNKGIIFNSSDNYFLKGVQVVDFGEILNRGVTSTEYLGGGEGSQCSVGSNHTPFDTDGVLVKGEKIFELAKSHGYGNLDIIINIDSPDIYNTDSGLQKYNSNMYEIFKNHGPHCDFYGIRTGIASIKFDAIIYRKNKLDIDFEELQLIKYFIAKNGFYLPVLSLDSELLFTPEEYYKLRQGFSFCDKFSGCDIEKKDGNFAVFDKKELINLGNENFQNFVQEQKNGIVSSVNTNTEDFAKLIFDKIKNILEFDFGIKCNQNKNLLGAELYDTGSTGRGTEIPCNDIDLDFTLLLNSQDYQNIENIQKTIHEKFGTIESTDHSTLEGNGLQLKSVKNSLGKEYGFENGIRFDLLIMKKTKSYLYPSNLAMQDRLSSIKDKLGQDSLNFVKNNIVIMKMLLKSQGTYKNTEGGMGGIGVENWIMQNHGNFVEALESFEEVAFGGKYEEGKNNISFDKFKNRYFIWDCGQNFKNGNNDNYIFKMNEKGYNGILYIIKRYRKEGLVGIFKLLQNYQMIKSEFLE